MPPLAQREEEETQTKLEASQLGVDYMDTRLVRDVDSILGLMTPEDIRSFGAVPLARKGLRVEFGYTDEADQGRFIALHDKLKQLDLHFHLISRAGFTEI